MTTQVAIDTANFDAWSGANYMTNLGNVRGASGIALTEAFGEPQLLSDRLQSAWVVSVDWDTEGLDATLGRTAGLRLVWRGEGHTVVPTQVMEEIEMGDELSSLLLDWKPTMSPEALAGAIMHTLERYSTKLEGGSEVGLSSCLTNLRREIEVRIRAI